MKGLFSPGHLRLRSAFGFGLGWYLKHTSNRRRWRDGGSTEGANDFIFGIGNPGSNDPGPRISSYSSGVAWSRPPMSHNLAGNSFPVAGQADDPEGAFATPDRITPTIWFGSAAERDLHRVGTSNATGFSEPEANLFDLRERLRQNHPWAGFEIAEDQDDGLGQNLCRSPGT